MVTRRLRDIEIEEISLVSKAATRKKFYIVKSQGGVNTMEQLEKLLNELNPEGNEIEVLRKAKDKLPKEMLDELTKAYKPILKYKDDFPDDLLEAIKILGKYASYGYAGPEGKGIKKAASWPSVTAQLFGTEEEDEGEED
jgi:hypothetical protein